MEEEIICARCKKPVKLVGKMGQEGLICSKCADKALKEILPNERRKEMC